MRYLLAVTLLFIIGFQAQGQIDKEFWFVAPEASVNHGDRPIFMRISTMETAATITLRMPADLSFPPIYQTILPNTTFSIDLTPWIDNIENNPANTILNHGLYLTSTSNVTAYYEIAHSNNPAIFPFKGKNGLGTDFFIPGQNNYANQTNNGSEAFDIIATEDNTLVTIIPKIDIVGHAAGVPFTITLNKGQTYSARTTNTTATATLAGSRVTSDKPIAITISDDSIITGGWDIIGDQLIPVNLLGKEYIVIKGYADNVNPSNNDERVYILATQNNTNIYLDGNTTPAATLNTSDLLSHPIDPANATVYITTNEPVYVYHLSGNPGESGSSLIPHDSCTGSGQIGFNRTSASFFAMLILTRSGNEDAFLLNGDNSVITAANFAPVPGTNGNWMFARMSMSTAQVPIGTNLLQNTEGKFHLGILNNLGGSSEYGFYSAFSSLYLGADKSICIGDSVQLDAGPYMTAYEWYKKSGLLFNLVGTSRYFMVHDSGTYLAVVTGDNCQLSDTINIAYYPNSTVSLGNDTTICQGTTLVLDPGAYWTYMWQDFSNGPTFNATTTGLYWVKVTNNNGCVAIDSMYLTVHPFPVPGTPITGLNPVCQGQDSVTFTAGAFSDAESYSWILPAGYTGISDTTVITIDFSTSALSDTIRLSASNYCGTSLTQAKLGITVNPLPNNAKPISGAATVCQGQTAVAYMLQSVLNSTSYVWTLPGGATISSGAGTNSITVDYSLIAVSGTISVSGQNSCGTGLPEYFPVTVNLFPDTAGSINGTFVVCQGQQNVSFTVPAITGADSCIWSLPPGASITSGAGTPSITVYFDSTSVSGTISVYGKSNLCGNGIPSSVSVTVNPLPSAAGAISGLSSVCQGQSNLMYTVPVISNASSYVWTIPVGASITGNPNNDTITVSFNTSAVSGMITVHGTNPLCGNGVSSSLSLTVNPLPVAAGSITGPSPVCQASSGKTYTIPVISYASAYEWIYSGTGATIFNNGNNVVIDMAPSATSGILTVNGLNTCGPGISSSFSIHVDPIPLTSLNVCQTITTHSAKPFTLRGGLPLNGVYYGTGVSGGVFNPAAVPSDTAIIHYRYMNVYGCENISSMIINVLPAAPFTCGNILTDVRDNKTYPTVQIGAQCWMAANLDHGTAISSNQFARDNCVAEKYCFGDNFSACSTWGGLYAWDEIMQYEAISGIQGLCPPGWHIPSENEWNILFSQYINSGFAGSSLKATGYSGFNAAMSGERFINNGWFMDNFSTFMWSCTSAGLLKAWAHGLNIHDPSVSRYPAYINNAFSIRCIKD